MIQHIAIPWSMWRDRRQLQLGVPPGWNVRVCPMRGAAALSQAEIEERLRRPGGAAWRDVVSGAATACIATDDLARPTPASRVLPAVCEELLGAGITDITIIIATGCHRPLSRAEMALKVGEEVLRAHRVINHNPFCGLVDLGRSSRGTPYRLNEEFCKADVRIVVGSVTPNYMAGFGGGAKLVLPGLASIETVCANHGLASGTEPGNLAQPIREEMEELAALVGVDVAVSCVLNADAEVSTVYVGRLRETYLQAAARARAINSTPAFGPADVLVLNAFPKDNELTQIKSAFNPVFSARTGLVRQGGTVVVVSSAWDGVGFHAMYANPEGLVRAHLRRMADYVDAQLVLCTSHAGKLTMGPEEGVQICADWKQVVSFIRERHGPEPLVSVFPQAALQICEPRGSHA